MSATHPPTSHELPLLLGRTPQAPESLLLIGLPDGDGMIAVRRWTADDWSAPATAHPERADALLRWIEEQARLGRTMNQSTHAVRLWLRGEGPASR